MVARAKAVGVGGFVVPSVTASRWQAVRDTVSSVANSVAGYGLHPCYLNEHSDDALDALATWIDEHGGVAIGECGLDFHVNAPDTESTQLSLFDGQIELAVQHHLPLIVHARKAVDQVTQRLRLGGATAGIVHSFSGSWQQACKLIDAGFHLGIGGSVTHNRALKLQRIVTSLPDDAWVLETDAPDQPGALHRGERNEPAYLLDVARTIADLRGVSVERISALSNRSCERLFGAII